MSQELSLWILKRLRLPCGMTRAALFNSLAAGRRGDVEAVFTILLEKGLIRHKGEGSPPKFVSILLQDIDY